MKLFLLALALLNGWRFYKTRDHWFLGLGLLFGLGLFQRKMPEAVFNVALVILLLWVGWLSAWRLVPALRIRKAMQKAFGNPKLGPLSTEELEWRKSLPKNQRDSLETLEIVYEKRFKMPEAVSFLESQRESDQESAARKAEYQLGMAAYEAEQRAAAAEEQELEISAATSPLEVVSASGSREWLKLDRIEGLDEDDAYRAPVRCTVWLTQPKADDGGKPSFASLAEMIGFPPDDTAGPTFWESASADFKNMFRSRCLVAGIDVADDGRERFDFRIGETTFVIMTKYLGWRTDLALDENQQRVWVRISGMNAETWSAPDANKPSEFKDIERIPAFVYPIPVDRLMPSTHPKAHFETLEKLQCPDE